MAPLIDVSFLLLIFFLVATTLLKKERDLGMMLPGPPDGRTEVQPRLPVVVLVRENGEVTLNPDFGETLVSLDPDERRLPVLREHLATMASVSGGDRMVVQLRAEDGAKHQRVVDVLNCLASMGVSSVGFTDFP